MHGAPSEIYASSDQEISGTTSQHDLGGEMHRSIRQWRTVGELPTKVNGGFAASLPRQQARCAGE